jgi:hypothetical protein
MRPFDSWHGPGSLNAHRELQAFLDTDIAKNAEELLHTWPWSGFEHAGQRREKRAQIGNTRESGDLIPVPRNTAPTYEEGGAAIQS